MHVLSPVVRLENLRIFSSQPVFRCSHPWLVPGRRREAPMWWGYAARAGKFRHMRWVFIKSWSTGRLGRQIAN